LTNQQTSKRGVRNDIIIGTFTHTCQIPSLQYQTCPLGNEENRVSFIPNTHIHTSRTTNERGQQKRRMWCNIYQAQRSRQALLQTPTDARNKLSAAGSQNTVDKTSENRSFLPTTARLVVACNKRKRYRVLH